MSGRPPGTLVQEIVSWLYGWVDSRPEVTKASSPPSGRLARERYRSHAKDRFAAGSHFALRPMREMVTRRSMGWLTISGVNVLAVKDVMRPVLTTTLVHSGWPWASWLESGEEAWVKGTCGSRRRAYTPPR